MEVEVHGIEVKEAVLCTWLAARLFFAQQTASRCRAIHTREAVVVEVGAAAVLGVSQ
jgi:hypothetical protein